MKVRSLLLIFLITMSFLGAQDFGIKGGINLGRFSGSNVDDISFGLNQSVEPGFEGGVFIALPINPVELRVEALFLHVGTKFEEKSDGTTEKYRYNLNYINVPVLAGINVNNFRFFAGPFVNLYLTGKLKYKIDNDGKYWDEDEKIERDDVNSVPMGIILGASYSMFDNLEIELRCLYGFNDLFNESLSTTIADMIENDNYDNSMVTDVDILSVKPITLQLYANFHLTK